MRTHIVFCILLILTSPLEGQGLDSASVVLLKPDRFVRIQLPELGRLQGNVGFISGSDLYLVTEDGSRTVSLAAVDTLWIRGRRTTLGAVIGGVIGLGGGFFLGLLAQGIGGAESSDNVVVPVALAGAAGGALVGAVAGATFRYWQRVVPRE
jgi:hypothetical protein